MNVSAKFHSLEQVQKVRNITPTRSIARHNCKCKVAVFLEEGLDPLTVCIEEPNLTCGWLIKDVIRRYTQMVDQVNKECHARKFKKKIIAAIKSVNKNESIDYWLTLYNRPLNVLPDNLQLQVHFSSILSCCLSRL